VVGLELPSRRSRVAPPWVWTSKEWSTSWKALTSRDFHKSMTTHADHRVWQDVYRPMSAVGEIYLKLTVIDDVLIVSFKEL
jgi:motility quorum-sensing regulator / GCU-specific mRNA interferase toxin